MKKKLVIITLVIFTIVVFFAYSILVGYPAVTVIPQEVILGAHRGDSVNYLENTLESFEAAVNNKDYKFIEFDVQYTKDKVLVVHHDLSLLRIQDKNYDIAELTYEELENVSDYHIPTYEEVLNLINHRKPLNVEIKSQGKFEEDKEIADFLIWDLNNREILNTTLISSISQEVILYINDNYNNRNSFTDYPLYWIAPRYVHTGVIFYVKESTFTENIPLLKDLMEQIRDSGLGWVNDIKTDMYVIGADHLMIHGANIRQYNRLYKELPFNTRLVFWKLDNTMHLVLPDKSIWKWYENYYDLPEYEVLPWWE
ncbi:MAG: glycerophosphodiester phosphodiesterase [Candidatus Pacearchaeota archaeon]